MAGEPREEPRPIPKRTPSLYDLFYGGLTPNPLVRQDLLDIVNQPRDLDPFVTIGGRRYRQVDNGRANVLVPTGEPGVSPGELARRQAALERVAFMANNPLAGAAYGAAAIAGASPQARDRAMMAGGAVDSAMFASAPLGARPRSPMRAPPTQPPLATSPRDPIRYGPVTEYGQASGANATITPSMIGTGKRVKRGLALPGLVDSSKQDRGHLVADILGGTGVDPREVVPLYRYPNRGPMNAFEQSVKRRARAGEVVEYFAKPLYNSAEMAPSSVLISAQGSRGGFTPRVIPNVPGRRK